MRTPFLVGLHSSQEKGATALVSALLSPHHHGLGQLFLPEVHPRHDICDSRRHQCNGSQLHVLLLPAQLVQVRSEAIDSVEEAHYAHSDGEENLKPFNEFF